MHDLDAIADRFEIEALRGEFTDALMMRDYDRFASLFTASGARLRGQVRGHHAPARIGARPPARLTHT